MVREDPVRQGLLFCGTEQAVYFSIDDGENWQPLRLNMPATSIRDLVVHADDLVVGTHGRSFWILDDVTPLRQLKGDTRFLDAVLFAPELATRVRRSVHTDTPFPPEEPAGQNPPDGAVINYYLKSRSPSPVTLDITDASGKLVRHFSSADKPLAVDPDTFRFPTYWIRPPHILKNEPGMQRFVWDLMYPNPPSDGYDLPISAIYKDTPFVPEGPFVMPGTYTLKLTANGKVVSQKLTVRMDPRVKAPTAALQQQFALSMQTYECIITAAALADSLKSVSERLATVRAKAANNPSLVAAIDAVEKKLKDLSGGPRSGRGAPADEVSLSSLPGSLTGLLGILQEADSAPTDQALKAAKDLQDALARSQKTWSDLKQTDLVPLNEKLKVASIAPIAF